MKRFAFIFVLAVILPSILLGWLALDSVRNQELVFERQEELLLQGVADRLAARIREYMAGELTEFGRQVDRLATASNQSAFDEQIRTQWPRAAIGFVVTLEGRLVAPPFNGDAQAKQFVLEN